MPNYLYRAFNSEGKKISGTIDADHELEAKERLREMGLAIISIQSQEATSQRFQLKGDNLANFTTQLAELLIANVPLYESLIALEEQSRGEKYHAIISGIASQIKAGQRLSQAMSNYPQSFSPLYCAMIQAGESSGSLDASLKKLSQLISRQQKFRKQIISSLTYPIILAVFSIIVIAVLIGFVLPSLEGLFEGRQLPAFSQAIMNIANLLRSYGWLFLTILIGIGLLIVNKRKEIAQGLLASYAMRIPFLKDAVIRASIARFARTLGTLLEGGVSMISSLEMAKKTLNNPNLEVIFDHAQERIIEGRSLSQELSRSRLVPTLFWRMIAIGEESGSLPQMLSHCAHLYEEDTERTLNRLVALVQPTILLIMGMIVGLILLAVLMPLSDLSSITAI